MKSAQLETDGVIRIAAYALVAAYLISSFMLIDNFGLGSECNNCIGLGHKYIHYYFTGELDFQDMQTPSIPGANAADFYRGQLRELPDCYYPFDAIFSTITCRLFYQKLHWLDHVSAHTIFCPIMIAVLLLALFHFTRRHWGGLTGLMAIAILITCPRFYGHTMYFLRDTPVALFFSLLVVVFAEWIVTQKTSWLYLGFGLVGCALADKPDWLLVPVILAIWISPLIIRSVWPATALKTSIQLICKRYLIHIIVGTALAFLIAWFFWPILHPWRHTAAFYLPRMLYVMRCNATWATTTWNFYAPFQALITTPPLVLLLFGFGLFWALKNLRQNQLNGLLIVWVLLPVFRHCLPHTNHYDGIRHFFFFYVPFSILTALGVTYLAKLLTTLPRVDKKWAYGLLLLAIFIQNGYAMITLHPYQEMYYNFFVGGLKGAQAKNIPYACDDNGNSYREAGKWLDRNAKTNAHFFAVIFETLPKFTITRNDLREIGAMSKPSDILPNTYLLVIHKKFWGGVTYNPYMDQKEMFIATRYLKVHEIQRQGGEVAAIYYNP